MSETESASPLEQLEQALAEIGGPGPIASIYHVFAEEVSRQREEHITFCKANRPAWDLFYDRANVIGEAKARELFPDSAAKVDAINASVAKLMAAQNRIPDFFERACLVKMESISQEQLASSDKIGPKWVSALDTFRAWRVAEMDGTDIDMLTLLEERTNYSGPKMGLFQKLFVTWAREIVPDLKKRGIEAVRGEVLDYLGANLPRALTKPRQRDIHQHKPDWWMQHGQFRANEIQRRVRALPVGDYCFPAVEDHSGPVLPTFPAESLEPIPLRPLATTQQPKMPKQASTDISF